MILSLKQINMLVFSAIVPHPPILIPNVGKDNLEKLKKTEEAYRLLKDELVKAEPETLIIISPHGELNVDAFTINTNEYYKVNFEDFGDFETKFEYKGDLGFINSLKGKFETELPLQLISEPKLDHGSAVPLFKLLGYNTKRRIVPIKHSFLSPEKHLRFGEMIKEIVLNQDKKYAIIASGDLSHKLTSQSPAGFSPKGREFDKKIIQFLKNKKVDSMVDMDPTFLQEAGQCGWRSILILLGVIKDMNYEIEVLSYESPFGVGYLTAQIIFG